MKRIMVHNNTACPIYVGASMVPAGESRDFPEDQVPAHLRPPETVVATKPALGELETAIREAAERSLPGGEYHGREDYVVSGISGHFKADPDAVRAKLREALEGAAKTAADSRAGELAELVTKAAKDVIAALPSIVDDADLGKLEALEKAKEAPRKGVLEALGAEVLKRAGAQG